MKKLLKLIKSIRKIFFGYNTPPCVGIDIGTTAVKMVELKANSLKILKHGIAPLDYNLVSQGVIGDIEQISDTIRGQWEKFDPDYEYVSIAMPYNSIIIKEMTVPVFKTKFDLDKYLQEQLIQDIGVNEIDFDYSVIEHLDDGQKLKVVVAKKEKIDEYQAMIQMTGIDVAAIDVEPFAIQHLFHLLLEKKQNRKDIILIDAGVSFVRGYLFINNECVYFTEIITNYKYIFEEYIDKYSSLIKNPKQDFLKNVTEILTNTNTDPVDLVDAIAMDISKLLQIIKSSILVEKKLAIANDYQICLMGGNSLLTGLTEKLIEINEVKVFYADELLKPENNNIPRGVLIRLVTSVALATWGHKIGKN